mmetsp:Transcript_25076/g.41107  ORF Transcript_25076/g.41107 Transcript_25076/m.41107 type:complete len:228 (+) Transcript_25076:454-1137(+)
MSPFFTVCKSESCKTKATGAVTTPADAATPVTRSALSFTSSVLPLVSSQIPFMRATSMFLIVLPIPGGSGVSGGGGGGTPSARGTLLGLAFLMCKKRFCKTLDVGTSMGPSFLLERLPRLPVSNDRASSLVATVKCSASLIIPESFKRRPASIIPLRHKPTPVRSVARPRSSRIRKNRRPMSKISSKASLLSLGRASLHSAASFSTRSSDSSTASSSCSTPWRIVLR